MKIKGKLIVIILVFIIILLIGILISFQILANPKYCKIDDDCILSCGQKIGRGNSYNKLYMKFRLNQPPEYTCCFCENCNPCVTNKCIDNVCTAVKTEGDCC